MAHDTVIWLMLVLTSPFALYAMTPVARLAYRIIGRRHLCRVLGVETARLSRTAKNQRALYQVSLRLRTDTGRDIHYTYRTLARDTPPARVKADSEVVLFAVPWLANRAGWRPQTAYAQGGALIDSPALYATFLVFGGLPFAAATYHLIWGGNMLFDLLRLL